MIIDQDIQFSQEGFQFFRHKSSVGALRLRPPQRHASRNHSSRTAPCGVMAAVLASIGEASCRMPCWRGGSAAEGSQEVVPARPYWKDRTVGAGSVDIGESGF